ncbi:MAG TPA: NUDIX hydrolase [Geobacteraceae bacterium]|nr:NUDIX hydrolase [Geobacteraceae bacterium]
MDTPMHMVVVCCLVRNDSGEVLMIRHFKRGWELPQGRVEEGETLMEALQREVREETGVEVVPGPLARVWSKLSSPSAVIFGFLADYAGGELRTSEESPEIGWFADGEAIAMVSHPVNRDRLRAMLDFTGTPIYGAYSSSPYRMEFETIL